MEIVVQDYGAFLSLASSDSLSNLLEPADIAQNLIGSHSIAGEGFLEA